MLRRFSHCHTGSAAMAAASSALKKGWGRRRLLRGAAAGAGGGGGGSEGCRRRFQAAPLDSLSAHPRHWPTPAPVHGHSPSWLQTPSLASLTQESLASNPCPLHFQGPYPRSSHLQLHLAFFPSSPPPTTTSTPLQLSKASSPPFVHICPPPLQLHLTSSPAFHPNPSQPSPPLSCPP